MDPHERRNDLPPVDERDTELLVHGTFCVAEGDRGFFDTRWLAADHILENVDKAVLQAKVETFKADMLRALAEVTDPPADRERRFDV